jgi:O-antigen/teichoic acid export membrane protein
VLWTVLSCGSYSAPGAGGSWEALLHTGSIRERILARVNDGRGVAAGTATSLLVRLAGITTTVVAMPIALHALGELRFGAFLLLFGIINWITLGSFGIHSALGRAIASKTVDTSELPELLGAALIYALITTVTMAILVSAAAAVWMLRIGVHQHLPLQEIELAAGVMISLITAQIILQVFEGIRIGHLKPYLTNLTRIAGSAFSFSCLLLLPRFWPSMVIFVIALNGGLLLGATLNAIFVLREIRPRFKNISHHIRRFRALAISGLAYFAIGISSLLQTHVPVVALASLRGPVASIDFGLFVRLLFVLMTGLSMVTTPLWPALLRARADADQAWIAKSLKLAALLVVGAGASAMIAIACFGGALIRLWTGRILIEPTIFQVLFGVYFLQMAWSHYWGTVLMGLGRERTVSCIILAEGTFMTLLAAGLASSYGASGMILGLVASFALISNWALPVVALRELGVFSPRATQEKRMSPGPSAFS